ncbi:hypothetical protein BRC82_00300 [Halobacteriales archaeon QS_1_67_19]|nr:MAG: hypothetical protein BRC82_00300 [Halobacteriales archaeon QS_1_67_19]
MHDDTTQDDSVQSLTDPESLRERPDVEFRETTRVHDDADHCAVGNDGVVAIGVTDADGKVLALRHDEGEAPVVLPNGRIESGEDWVAVGRERVEHLTDLPVEIEGPERVRKVEHVVEGDDERHTTSHEVVFRASPAGDPDRVTDGCDWHAAWLDEFPDDATTDDGPAAADVRLFTG